MDLRKEMQGYKRRRSNSKNFFFYKSIKERQKNKEQKNRRTNRC